MSGRDLLYKPPVPAPAPDEDGHKGKRVGVKGPRGRELGGVGEIYETKAPTSSVEAPPDAASSRQRLKRAPAFRDAYFTKDVSAVQQANQRASDMQALRGAEGVTDLKTIVLPRSPHGVQTPSPEVLFDLAKDPGENTNFAEDPAYADEMVKFRARLAELGHGPDACENYVNAGY